MTQIPGPAAGPTPQDAPASGVDRFFDWLRSIDLRRDSDEKWLAGVCSGIATRLGIDPIVVRAALVLLVLLGGVGITLYLIAWAFIPNDRNEILAERAVRQGEVLPIILLVVIVLSLLGGTSFAHDTPGVVWFWWLAVPMGVVIWAVTRGRGTTAPPMMATSDPAHAAPTPAWSPGAAPTTTTMPTSPSTTAPYASTVTAPYGTAPYGTTPYGTAPYGSPVAPPSPVLAPVPYAAPGSGGPGVPPPPAPVASRPPRAPRPPRPPRRRSAGFVGALLVTGVALAVYGVTLWLHEANHWSGSSQTVALGAALVVFGGSVLGFGIAGLRSGLTGFLAIVLALVTWTSSVLPDVDVGGGIGDRVWRPSSTETSLHYRLGIGSAQLDLANLPQATGNPAPVDARVGVGELRILIPSTLTVEVHSSVGAGDIGRIEDPTVDSGSASRNISTTETFGTGSPDVVVTAHVGLGQILIGKE